jgi:hypothetical protein
MAVEPSSRSLDHPSLSMGRKSFALLFSSLPSSSSCSVGIHTLSSYKWELAFRLDFDVAQLSQPFHLDLIGKFSHGKPIIEVMRKEINTIRLKD